MLLALLYCEENQIAAAAPACDQMIHGDSYWKEIFGGHLEHGSLFETAYVYINNVDLRRRLLMIGFDQEVCGRVLAEELEETLTPNYLPGQAA